MIEKIVKFLKEKVRRVSIHYEISWNEYYVLEVKEIKNRDNHSIRLTLGTQDGKKECIIHLVLNKVV